MKKRVLLIEDDPSLQVLFEKFLVFKQLEYTIAETIPDAEAVLHNHPVDAVLADVEIQDGKTLSIMSYCQLQGIPCVAFSSNDLNRNEAMDNGAITFVAKPVMMTKLEYMLQRVGLA